MPVNAWLGAGLADFTREALAAPRVAQAGLVRPDAVAELVARFQGGEAALANRVLSLIALQLWWEDYLGDSRVY